MDEVVSVGAVLSSLKIEPFVFLFVFSTSLSDLTSTQLIQYKICLNTYNQSIRWLLRTNKFCKNIWSSWQWRRHKKPNTLRFGSI